MKRRKGWIRRADGTADTRAKIQAQALRGAVWVLAWADPEARPRDHRICETRKEAEHLIEVWSRWHERLGWKVWSFGGAKYAHPTVRPGLPMERSIINIRKLDPETLQEEA